MRIPLIAVRRMGWKGSGKSTQSLLQESMQDFLWLGW
jgi:hypothetical protein